MNPLSDSEVRRGTSQAWLDSNPGVFGGHEEGGFILRDANGALSITRWPRGDKAYIETPPHSRCRYNGKDVIATFHTHPNTGRSYDQEPDAFDCAAVRDDADLKAAHYIGEFVVSAAMVYIIHPDGEWAVWGSTEEVLNVNSGNR
jgi:hypothetical protein